MISIVCQKNNFTRFNARFPKPGRFKDNYFSEHLYSVSRLDEGQPPPTPPYQGGESPRLNKEGVRGWLYLTQTGNAIAFSIDVVSGIAI